MIWFIEKNNRPDNKVSLTWRFFIRSCYWFIEIDKRVHLIESKKKFYACTLLANEVYALKRKMLFKQILKMKKNLLN